MPAKQAKRDIRKKIKLGNQFIKELRPFNDKIVKDVVRSYSKNGEIISAGKFNPEMEAMLLNHYERTGDQFNDQIAKTLPKELAETPEERSAIIGILATYYIARAVNQTGRIMNTTQKNINKSILEGTRQAVANVIPGSFPSRRDIALNAGTILKRQLNGRNSGIAGTETQNIAEEAKQVEAEQLTIGAPKEVEPDKEWVTAGDELVRRTPFSHVAADSQKVKLNDLFTVSGEILKMPGDTSHGASLGNVINCRCASVIDREQVLSARKFIFAANEEIETDVDIPEFAFN